MLLHAKHAADESSPLIIASEDNDVLIICLSLVQNFACRMYIKCGAKNRERFVDVQNVAAALGHNVCCALPGMHSFTGCDTVSTFGGKGKINALKLIQKNKKYQDAFTKFGEERSMKTELFNMLQEFTCMLCMLYANKCPSTTIN